MAFNVKSKKTGKTYYLHCKKVTLKGNRIQTIYYFAGTIGDNNVMGLPEGFEVFENLRTGLPMLRRKIN